MINSIFLYGGYSFMEDIHWVIAKVENGIFENLIIKDNKINSTKLLSQEIYFFTGNKPGFGVITIL